ncbi:MAG: hypothetical protein HC899_29790 [Leptolyngbyaceae cyanobacterium SM1_4_3]|nr:hypothetical protein [Leptolyngbyaceae cyanobacterium SM1_4_3]NJN89999.1 hypothetical protein [Leptolyngbyaceae cyanobacterium SL_5_14]
MEFEVLHPAVGIYYCLLIISHWRNVQLKVWKPKLSVEQARCLLDLDGQEAHSTGGLEKVAHCVIDCWSLVKTKDRRQITPPKPLLGG